MNKKRLRGGAAFACFTGCFGFAQDYSDSNCSERQGLPTPKKTRKALLRTPSSLVLVACRSARSRGGTGNARDARGAGSASHRIFVNFYSCWSEAHSNSFLCCLLPGVVHSRSLLRQLDRIPASCFLFTRKCDRNTSCCVVCFYSYFVSEWVKVIGFPVVVSLNFLCLFAQKCAFRVYEYSTYHNRNFGR